MRFIKNKCLDNFLNWDDTQYRLKTLGVIFFTILLALNALMGASLSDSYASKIFDVGSDCNFTSQTSDSTNQCYALEPSVQYNSIDKSRERRRNNVAANLCFSAAGALGVIALIFLKRFYEIFVSCSHVIVFWTAFVESVILRPFSRKLQTNLLI